MPDATPRDVIMLKVVLMNRSQRLRLSGFSSQVLKATSLSADLELVSRRFGDTWIATTCRSARMVFDHGAAP